MPKVNVFVKLFKHLFLYKPILIIGFFLANLQFTFAKVTPLRIVGSTAVYPYAASAAELHSDLTNLPTPIVESIGTGGGFQLMCANNNANVPDIIMASRAIADTEESICYHSGVSKIYEIKIGYDGIVFIQSNNSSSFSLTPQLVFLALAKKIPIKGKFILNPYQYWDEIDSDLPHVKIHFYGPSPASGTRDIFSKLLLIPGCKEALKSLGLKKLDPHRCQKLRQDGVYVDIGGNENFIVQKALISPSSLGIVSFSYAKHNKDRLIFFPMNGILPTPETIQSGAYPISRPLYVYVPFNPPRHKQIAGYLEVLLKTGQASEYLTKKGLIPLSVREYEEAKQTIRDILKDDIHEEKRPK